MAEQDNPSADQDELSAKLLKLLSELNPQQFAFFQSYFSRQSAGFGNASKATELAGYAGEPGSVQLSVQGHRLLNNPKIRRCMEAVFEQAGCTLELDAKVIFEGMTATRTRYLRGENNSIISTPPEVDHQTRLRAVELRYRLLRTQPATVTHQPLPAADSGVTTTKEHELCPNCGEAFNPSSGTGDPVREAIDKLDPAQYDRTLRLANVLDEYIDLKEQEKADLQEEEKTDAEET